MTELDIVRDRWNQGAREDPLFFILSDLSRRGRMWIPEEFFATGRREIAASMVLLDKVAPDRKTDRALDFGCGVGRLTEALSLHYKRVTGTDISEEMIRQAKTLTPDSVCDYRVNGSDLGIFKDRTFDLAYSMLVMQHMPPECVLVYMAEFARILRPGGLMMIESRNCDYACPSDVEVFRLLAASGMDVLDRGIPDTYLARRRDVSA